MCHFCCSKNTESNTIAIGQDQNVEETKSVLVKSWGQEMYDRKITDLMEKMLDDNKLCGEDFIANNTISSNGNNDEIDKVDSD